MNHEKRKGRAVFCFLLGILTIAAGLALWSTALSIVFAGLATSVISCINYSNIVDEQREKKAKEE